MDGTVRVRLRNDYEPRYVSQVGRMVTAGEVVSVAPNVAEHMVYADGDFEYAGPEESCDERCN